MKRFTVSLMLVGALIGCDSLFPPTDSPPSDTNPDPNGTNPTPASGDVLKTFESEEDLVAYFSGQVMEGHMGFSRMGEGGMGMGDVLESTAPDSGGFDAPAAAPAPASGAPVAQNQSIGVDGDFSGTTVQEVGVDEADVVKTDGKYLYIVSNSVLRIGNRSRHSTRSCLRIATAPPGFHGGVAAVLPIMV